ALVQLAAELSVGHVELEHRVAWHQRHARQVRDIPRGDDQPARVGIAPDLVDDPLDLVDLLAIGSRPAAPLLAVDRAELACGIGPLVPDRDLVVLQVGDVGFTLQEPQQLMHDRAQVQLLGRDQRKAFVEVEPHLPAEHAARAGAGAVRFFRTVFEDVAKELQVLLHRTGLLSAIAPAAASASAARATGRTGPARPAAGSAPAPWSASRRRGNRDRRSAHPARARTRRRNGTRRTTTRTRLTRRSADAACASTTTAP